MTQAMGLRERKKVKTHKALVDVATRLFLERGFENVTVDEIAEAAEVSRSTFFRYFKTKEAVVFPDQDERLVRLDELIRGFEEAHPPFEAVRRGLLEMARHFMEERESLAAQRRIIHESPLLQSRQVELDAAWQEVIADRLIACTDRRAGTMRQARMVAGATFGVIEVVLREWFDGGCRKDLVSLGEDAMSLLQQGVERHGLFSKARGRRRAAGSR